MIDMMRYLDDRFTLDLMLINSNPRYMKELKQRTKDNARIRFRDPVPMEAISRTINDYDIGLYLLPPVNFNHQLALPNKIFEFMQARLAIAIGPSPEMSRLVKKFEIGIVAEDFEPKTLAKRLNTLSVDDINKMKQNAALAAKEIHAGVVAEQLHEIVRNTLEGHRHA
jgi:hypothetical protein